MRKARVRIGTIQDNLLIHILSAEGMEYVGRKMRNKHKKVAKLVIYDVHRIGSPLFNLLILNIVMEIIYHLM